VENSREIPETTSKPRIARAAHAHLAALVHGNAAMALETEGRELERQRLESGVRAVLDEPSRGFYLVATEPDGSGEVVGQLMVTFEWSDWRAGTFWWIQSVYVEPAWRRRGVYRALYEHLLELARADGSVCGVRLYVERDNARARATYEALGMQRAVYELYEVDFVLGHAPEPAEQATR
jgi:ribosomal protein S18 acetylase RimI-like enzyme